MFCKYCGSELDGNANFCTRCGNAVSGEAEIYTPEPMMAGDVNYGYVAPTEIINEDDPVKDGKAGDILKYGILGLAFGVTFFLSFLGIIFSAIAKSKISDYVTMYGATEGKAAVGRGLSTAGMIVSIILTVFFIFYVGLIGLLIAVA